jgi:hypothetical protein
LKIEEHYNQGGNCWSWLQCKSHIAKERKKKFKQIIGEVPDCLEKWRVEELYAIYRDLKFLISTHQTVKPENNFSLYLCIFFLLYMLLFRVLWDVVQILTLENVGVLDVMEWLRVKYMCCNNFHVVSVYFLVVDFDNGVIFSLILEFPLCTLVLLIALLLLIPNTYFALCCW